MKLLKLLKLAPTEKDKRLQELIRNSYQSVEVVGRGTVKIDPREIHESEEFQRAVKEARSIVSSS